MIYLVLLCLISQSVTSFEIPTTIQTSLGDVLGVRHTESFTKKPIYEFRKIPYAKPPVGKLRFTKPKPYGRWLGTLDATKFGPSCYQDLEKSTAFLPNTKISEHCLFLNIYVPNNVSRSNNKSVMVWIHDGDYKKGQGMTFNGALLACIGDVIVVTINYRLGIFGFLSTGDNAASGNYGLLDQIVAIIWIRRNIKSYGGNPKSITLFGHSAGAMSISLHTLYRKNTNLFQRIILQSGFGTSPLALSTNVPHYTKQVAKLIRCSSHNTTTVVNCLRKATSKDLQSAFRDISSKMDSPKVSPMFGPRVSGKYISDTPSKLLRNSKSSEFYRSLDVIIGNVDSEGSAYYKLLQPYQKQFNFNISQGIPKRILCDHVAPIVTAEFYHSHSGLSEAFCNKYGRGLTLAKQTSDQVDFYGDLMFYHPTVYGLAVHGSKNTSGKCFQYIFKRKTELTLTTKLPSWIKGAVHGAEIYFVSPFLELLTLSPPDGTLAQTMMKYWTNFAKHG